MKKLLLAFCLIAGSLGLDLDGNLWAQKSIDLDALSDRQARNSFDKFKELLALANDANHPEQIKANIQWCESAFAERGFEVKRLKQNQAEFLLAERRFVKKGKTVLIYLQIDGQPVDTARWQQDDPYKATLKEKSDDGSWETIDWAKLEHYQDDWRIFARSASDAKGPVAMFLAAMEALDSLKLKPNYNLKVIMDFEEELGSPNLPQMVLANQEALQADRLIIFDGPRHMSNKPTLTFGARGIATIQLTTYGPIKPQHSGHYGNYVPNPAFDLARILTSLKDKDGRVLVEGFYDNITIDEELSTLLAAVPDDEKTLMENLQLARLDKVGKSYQESIQYPSLNIRGMQSGWINEEVRTIIPAWARAEIDVRLVLESDAEQLLTGIKRHIEAQGFTLIDHEPSSEERKNIPNLLSFTSEVSYQSFRTDMNGETGLWLRSALKKAFGIEPILLRMSGGSIPISPFVNTLGIPAVTVPTVNRDNNQHSPNENLRLGNYREGIKTIFAILTEKI